MRSSGSTQGSQEERPTQNLQRWDRSHRRLEPLTLWASLRSPRNPWQAMRHLCLFFQSRSEGSLAACRNFFSSCNVQRGQPKASLAKIQTKKQRVLFPWFHLPFGIASGRLSHPYPRTDRRSPPLRRFEKKIKTKSWILTKNYFLSHKIICLHKLTY